MVMCGIVLFSNGGVERGCVAVECSIVSLRSNKVGFCTVVAMFGNVMYGSSRVRLCFAKVKLRLVAFCDGIVGSRLVL